MNNPARILVVDDERFHLNVIVGLLSDEYRVLIAKSGARALEIATADPMPDLVLLDIFMPEMDGYEVCQRLKDDERTRHIPVIYLTAKSDVEAEAHGFSLGAVDYLSKPISPPIVKARVKNHLAYAQALWDLEQQNELLECKIQERVLEIARTQDVAIHCLASLAETRDNETGNHIRRTQHYIKLLAEQLLDHPRFCNLLDADIIKLMFKSAPLHDIGKVGVPDRILLKAGALNQEEWVEMKKHAAHAYDAICRAEQALGSSSFLHSAREIAYTHHEKWDGTGYPRGLKGDDIPLSGRLMSLADVYDALISKRVYKPAYSHEKARGIILDGKGSYFDPDIVDAFIEIEDQFIAVAKQFEDDS